MYVLFENMATFLFGKPLNSVVFAKYYHRIVLYNAVFFLLFNIIKMICL